MHKLPPSLKSSNLKVSPQVEEQKKKKTEAAKFENAFFI